LSEPYVNKANGVVKVRSLHCGEASLKNARHEREKQRRQIYRRWHASKKDDGDRKAAKDILSDRHSRAQ